MLDACAPVRASTLQHANVKQCMVGTPGFEPGTSAPPERRANRAAPCPEWYAFIVKGVAAGSASHSRKTDANAGMSVSMRILTNTASHPRSFHKLSLLARCACPARWRYEDRNSLCISTRKARSVRRRWANARRCSSCCKACRAPAMVYFSSLSS